jgi:hypothetical protein
MAGAVLGAITGLPFHFRVSETGFLAAFFDGLFWSLFRGVVAGALFGGLLGGIAGFGWWRQAAPTASARNRMWSRSTRAGARPKRVAFSRPAARGRFERVASRELGQGLQRSLAISGKLNAFPGRSAREARQSRGTIATIGMSLASSRAMAVADPSCLDLPGMLARLRRFEAAAERYRQAGISHKAGTMLLVMKLEQASIRRHCELHELPLPTDLASRTAP